MSTQGSIPSGRAVPEHLENQQVSGHATGQPSGVWSGVGPKLPEVGEIVEVWWADKWFRERVTATEHDDVEGRCVCVSNGRRTLVASLEGFGVSWRWPVYEPDVTHGKNGVPELPAVLEEPVRCRGLTEFNHSWVCEAILGPGEGDQCAHCRNLEQQIRAEDAAVEEGERRDAEQAAAFEQLLRAHQGDARAVVGGVVRTLVASGALSEGNARVLRTSAENVIGHAFEQAAGLSGLPLMLFWSLVADMASAERNSLRAGAVEAVAGCA